MSTVFENLLNDFSKIASDVEKDPTFLEISGYPHYENVCSNILSFFLDPSREHGLSSLVLESLLACHDDETKLGNVSIDREFPTDDGRIDLVIHSDSHIIAIENKVFHTPENPFSDYEKKINDISNGRTCIFLILGLSEEKSDKLGSFKSITYPQLFSNIKNRAGNHIQGSNNKYLIFLFEFITSIENLISGGRVDKGIINFFAENSQETTSFIKSYESVRRELRRKVESVYGQISFEEFDCKPSQGLYRETGNLTDCVFFDVCIDDQKIAIDCHISPNGWEITIFPRDGSMENLKESLHSRGIPHNPSNRLEYGKTRPYDYQISELIAEIKKLILRTQSASGDQTKPN